MRSPLVRRVRLATLLLALGLVAAPGPARAQTVEVGARASAVPASPRLLLTPARPNPFTSSTRLSLTLDAPAPVVVAVYDALGRRVATLHDGTLEAGTHALVFPAGQLRGGLYLVRAVGQNGQTATRPVVLSR